ncbi:MAG: penicillin-binding protein 2 [Patescibacteria group bacterium]
MSTDPFQWRNDGGLGQSIRTETPSVISHEVMYEKDFTHVKDSPLFMGNAIPQKRFKMVVGLVALTITVLVGRAFWMQIVNGASFRAQADRNRLRYEVELSKRGVIRDRNGVVLAENMPSFEVRAIERLLPLHESERAELLAKVGRIIGLPVTEIEQIFASSTDPDASSVLKRDIPYEQAIAVNILAGQNPSLEIAVGSKRKYHSAPDVLSLSHVLGYLAPITPEELDEKRKQGYSQIDLIGKTGVEAEYEETLRGTPGVTIYEVDSRHRKTAVIEERPSKDGTDLVLAIDARLQLAAERALRDGLQKAKVTRGAVVVLDPQDGEILAAVSLPAYDNNIFSGTVSSTRYRSLLQDEDRPFLPRAWAGVYPSGSTAKPVIATAGLAEGVITSKTTVLSTGGLQIGPWFFPDWSAGGHGVTNVRRAIAWSVNTFFYELGGGYEKFIGLGVDRLTDWMRRFGLGYKTGLDMPGEAAGFVPSREWKEKVKGERWYIGDTYNLSIGQGDLLVTPLQVALFTAEIANGGLKITPHFMKYQTSNVGRPTSERVAPEDAVQTVRLGMRDTVIYGSGRALAGFPVPVAGKTGTAQWRSDKANHAWFTAFAPFEKPEIVVTVLLEEGVEGSRTAIPVARAVLDAWLKLR